MVIRMDLTRVFAGNGLVSSSLKPELTSGYEAGFDLNLLKDRITTSVTYSVLKQRSNC